MRTTTRSHPRTHARTRARATSPTPTPTPTPRRAVEAYVGAAAVRDISRAQATTFQMLHDDLEDVAVAEKRFFSESRV